MLDKISKALCNPKRALLYCLEKGLLNWVPDKSYLKLKYFLKTNKKLNLANPISYNEKLQWLKLYNRKPEYIKYVDKYSVREHIKEVLGNEVLIPIYGVYDNAKQIDFSSLPNQFVLKCSHDSGSVIIVKNKDKMNREAVIDKLNKSLKKSYFYHSREWPYKYVNAKIICEKYLVDESGDDLKDYKIFCFNGEPKIIQVDFNRFTDHKRNLYTTDWTFIDASMNYPSQASVVIQRPEKLDTMLEYAKKLSIGIPHVRVDFYSIRNQIYFGELTFFHGSGFVRFSPESFNELLGSWLQLPLD